MYTISALYINISELEVREGYFIYKAAFETSPRFSNEIGKFLFYRLAGRSRRKNRKNRKKSGMANAFSRQVDRQARWLGKVGHEGMARQGGRPGGQAGGQACWVMKVWLGKVEGFWGRQARWLGKVGHEGMARQGGRPKNQAWRVRQGRRSGKARSGHR